MRVNAEKARGVREKQAKLLADRAAAEQAYVNKAKALVAAERNDPDRQRLKHEVELEAERRRQSTHAEEQERVHAARQKAERVKAQNASVASSVRAHRSPRSSPLRTRP